MKTATAVVLAVIILLAGITAAGVVGMIIRGEAKEPAQQAPAMPLVHCHAQGGEVVDGKCVPHRSKK
jgi:hypothetical protein